MIKVENISKIFQKEVKINTGKKNIVQKQDFYGVNNVSFEVEKGEIFGILGPNGAGKTTLLRMLGGIMTPSSGNIQINGIYYGEDEQRKNSVNPKEMIGYLSGNTRLYGKLTPRELLIMWGQLYEMANEEVYKNLEIVINTLDMSEFIDSRIENLSTGQTQRTSIARCLIHRPQIYIFDEPTLGLDIISSHGIIEFMKSEKKDGKTVLYSTHYMEEAEALCDRIMLMYKGQIMDIGTVKELKERSNTNNLRDAFISLAMKGGEII